MEHRTAILLLKPTEAAAALGISRSKVYELLARRVIPSVRLDGSIRVPAIQLQAWIEAQMREQEEIAGR
jgi:excisionase family DNA binding protein